MKKVLITMLTLIFVVGASAPALACGHNRHHKHHHVYTQNSYEYYHDILGKSKAWYLINIKKLP